jgi:Ca2+-binding RTX toxin-like protein
MYPVRIFGRVTRLLVLALLAGLASAWLVATSAAGAEVASPTCADQPATLVGRADPDLILRGTEFRDVVVTNGAGGANALGGDDLICITGGTSTVDAGDGDDEVYSSATNPDLQLLVSLGDGVDHFYGGVGGETISTEDGADGVSDPDVVRAGPGRDRLWGAGQDFLPFADDVDLGDGDDIAEVPQSGFVPGARLIGGPGADMLEPVAGLEDFANPATRKVVWRFDNSSTTGSATADGVERMTWDGFEQFYLDRVYGPVSFVGGDGDDFVALNHVVSADLGDGDDEIDFVEGPAQGRVDGGTGHDGFVSTRCGGSLKLDLGAGRYTCRHSTPRGPRTATGFPFGFEAAEVDAQKVAVRGTPRADYITVLACGGTVNGLGGNDRLRARFSIGRSGYYCRRSLPPVRLLGGPGDDVLNGSLLANVLLGGSGNDVLNGARGSDLAVGGPGTDRCTAERARTCES